MEQIQLEASIPLLPVISLKETEAFFEDLGFKNIYKDNERSSAYAVMETSLSFCNLTKQKRNKDNRFEKLYWERYPLLYSHESPIEAKKMMKRGLKLSDLEAESSDLVFQFFFISAQLSYARKCGLSYSVSSTSTKMAKPFIE